MHKKYYISDIFDVKNTASVQKKDVTFVKDGVPYVTASEGNNAVVGYVRPTDGMPMEKGNSIMIGGKSLVITYQESDYISNDSHNLSLSVKDSKYRTREIQLYLCSALRKALSPLYNWGNSISYKKIQENQITLPSVRKLVPDWAAVKSLSLSLSLSLSRQQIGRVS